MQQGILEADALAEYVHEILQTACCTYIQGERDGMHTCRKRGFYHVPVGGDIPGQVICDLMRETDLIHLVCELI